METPSVDEMVAWKAGKLASWMAAQTAVVWAFSTVATLVRGTVYCWVVYSVVPMAGPMADPKELMKAVSSDDLTVERKVAPLVAALVVSMESSTAARTVLPTVDKKADSTVSRSVDPTVGQLEARTVDGLADSKVESSVAATVVNWDVYSVVRSVGWLVSYLADSTVV